MSNRVFSLSTEKKINFQEPVIGINPPERPVFPRDRYKTDGLVEIHEGKPRIEPIIPDGYLPENASQTASEEHEENRLVETLRTRGWLTPQEKSRLAELLKKRPIQTDAKIVAKKLFGINLSGE